MCQRPLTQKRTLGGGGALERGHGASVEPLAQLGDALGGVGAAAAIIKAAELVVRQTAKGKRSVKLWRGGREVAGGGEMGAREHARPTRPTGGRGSGPRGGRWRVALRGCGEMGKGACVCAFASKECVFGKGTCSLSDTEGNAEVFAFVSVGADTKANT